MEKGAWKDLVAPGEYMWYRTMLGFGIQLLQQFSGINAVRIESRSKSLPFLVLFDCGGVGGVRIAFSPLVVVYWAPSWYLVTGKVRGYLNNRAKNRRPIEGWSDT